MLSSVAPVIRPTIIACPLRRTAVSMYMQPGQGEDVNWVLWSDCCWLSIWTERLKAFSVLQTVYLGPQPSAEGAAFLSVPERNCTRLIQQITSY